MSLPCSLQKCFSSDATPLDHMSKTGALRKLGQLSGMFYQGCSSSPDCQGFSLYCNKNMELREMRFPKMKPSSSWLLHIQAPQILQHYPTCVPPQTWPQRHQFHANGCLWGLCAPAILHWGVAVYQTSEFWYVQKSLMLCFFSCFLWRQKDEWETPELLTK